MGFEFCFPTVAYATVAALARRSRHPAHPGPLGKSPSTLSFPRANPKGTFQVRHQRTQPLGSGPHGPPSSCPQRVCVQWCTPSLSPLGSPVVCCGVRFPFDGAGPCSQSAPPLPHVPEFVIITILFNTYMTTLRVIMRLLEGGTYQYPHMEFPSLRFGPFVRPLLRGCPSPFVS